MIKTTDAAPDTAQLSLPEAADLSLPDPSAKR